MRDISQESHYTARAQTYDQHAFIAGDEHFVALEYMVGLCGIVGVTSILDVGAGTGRAARVIKMRCPGMEVYGVEPVEALLKVAEASSREIHYLRAQGGALPFGDESFDAVCATGVLHHVKNPSSVIAEMTRIARRAIFISDSNRFGQGTFAARLLKLGLYRAGLGRAVASVQSRGRGYLFSEGDGQFYSYSVFDSVPELAGWADRLVSIGTAKDSVTGSPLLRASHVLVAAIREKSVSGFAEFPTAGGHEQ